MSSETLSEEIKASIIDLALAFEELLDRGDKEHQTKVWGLWKSFFSREKRGPPYPVHHGVYDSYAMTTYDRGRHEEISIPEQFEDLLFDVSTKYYATTIDFTMAFDGEHVSIAICSPVDNFSRKIGAMIACNRLENKQEIFRRHEHYPYLVQLDEAPVSCI